MTINIELTRNEAGLLKKIMKAVIQQKGYLVILRDGNGKDLFLNNEAGLPFDDLLLSVIKQVNFQESKELETRIQEKLHEASKREDFMQEVKSDRND